MADDGRSQDSYEFLDATVALRPPRVAIVIDDDSLWRDRSAHALFAASRTWGGAGFVIAPITADGCSPEIARMVNAYDPDYVVGLGYTLAEADDLGIVDLSATMDGEQQALVLADSRQSGRTVAITNSDAVAGACSPYVEDAGELDFRPVTFLSTASAPSPLVFIDKFPSAPALPAALGVPEGITGSLALMVAQRCGFARQPKRSQQRSTASADDQQELLRYALYIDEGWLGPPRSLVHHNGPAQGWKISDVKDSWQPSQLAVTWVSRPAARSKRLIVLGDSAADFALALGWDRMTGKGTSLWMPINADADPTMIETLGAALSRLWEAGRMHNVELIVTSCAHDQVTVDKIMTDALATSMSWSVIDEVSPEPRPTPRYVRPELVEYQAIGHLACIPEDYDIRLTLPTRPDGKGGVECLTRIPAQVPSAPELRERQEAFWEVDVSLKPATVPSGRSLPRSALVANEHEWTRVRPSRAGVSFNSIDMGFVPGGYTLRQRTAQPRLRYPGLTEWIGHVVGTDATITPSDAGYRAEVCARVWGGRRQLASDIQLVRPLLDGFQARSTSTSTAFPESDGVCVRGREAVLTFSAACRLLGPDLDQEQVRALLDRCLKHGALRRGLVLGCAACSSKHFTDIGDLGQMNRCPRCDDEAPLTKDRWRLPQDEPLWFYDLHGALRDLLEQNGDVPLLAAGYFAATARTYDDLVETSIVTDQESAEVDLVAVVDDQLIVGEAKKTTAGSSKSQLSKLVRAAARLHADRIALLAGQATPWAVTVIEHVQQEIVRQHWIDGRQPELVTVTGLYGTAPTETRAGSRLKT